MSRPQDRAANVGAFFDLDGTLLGAPSLERRLVRYLRRTAMLGCGAGLRWLARFARRLCAWRRVGREERWMAATDGNKAHLAGVSKAATERFVTRLARGRIQFFSGALRRVAWHVAQDHAVYIITGSLGPLAVCAAWQLALRLAEFTGGKRPRVRVCATELEERGGRWTGEVAGEAMCGAAKARAVQRLAQEDGLDLRRSYAYGDRWSDRWMLESVGHAAAVNPSRALEREARRRGWAVLQWAKEESEGLEQETLGESREPKEYGREAPALVARAGRSG